MVREMQKGEKKRKGEKGCNGHKPISRKKEVEVSRNEVTQGHSLREPDLICSH